MISFQAGQRLTADALQALAPTRIVQGTQQDVASSTALVDTAIVVPIDGFTRVWLQVRFAMLGGGISWAWRTAGTITTYNRAIYSAGSATSGTNFDIAAMRMREIATLTEVQSMSNFQNSTTHAFWESLVVEGSGDLTLQFAQQASHASATSINANSFALYTRLA